MTHPFTPLQTFSDNTVPKVTADFLNQLQAGLNAVAAPVYTQLPQVEINTDGTNLIVSWSEILIKDQATSKYVYCASGYDVSTPSGLDANKWYYVYLVSTNGVPSIELSKDEPRSFMQGLLNPSCLVPMFKATRASLQFGGGLDTVFEGQDFNLGPPGPLVVTLETVADGTGSGSLTLGTGDLTIHFEPGVTTVADVEALFPHPTSYTDAVRVKIPGTGSTVLQSPLDVHPTTPLTGGFGDETRRYLGTVYSTDTGVLAPQHTMNGTTRWATAIANSSTHYVANAGGTTSWTPEHTETGYFAAPPHARWRHYLCRLSDSVSPTTANALYVRPSGVSTTEILTATLLGGGTREVNSVPVELPIIPGYIMEWKTLATAGTVVILSTGWREF